MLPRAHHRLLVVAFAFVLGLPLAASAQEDAEGCKDHQLFNRMSGFYLSRCDATQFDLRRFPKGALKDTPDGKRPANVEVEGPVWHLVYSLKEGVTRSSPLQIMRNFQNAARRGGAAIEGEYPGWCAGMVDETMRVGNGCTDHGVSMRFTRGEKETWAYVQALADGAGYELVISDREAMKQEIVASELLDTLNTDGFVALYINFETGKATITPDSEAIVNEVAAALKEAPALKIEVAGHTDNVGAADANQTLSEARAQAVVAALTARGIDASRLTAAGYGQSSPIADNRTEDGRAKNRRVELVKK
jgi:OmpA-OmpF porin, OOP family